MADRGFGIVNTGKTALDADPQDDPTFCLGWQGTDALPIILARRLNGIIRAHGFRLVSKGGFACYDYTFAVHAAI